MQLKELIQMISTQTNTVFIYDEKHLQGKLSFTSPPNFKISIQDLFLLFETFLHRQNLTMVRHNETNIIEVLPFSKARYSRLPLIDTENGKH